MSSSATGASAGVDDRAAPVAERLWAVLLTGIPFSVFKIGGGIAAAEDIHPWIGWGFVGWGVLDVLFNLAALVRPVAASYCVLSNVGRLIDRRVARGRSEAPEARSSGAGGSPRVPGRRAESLLLAVDTLGAFALVSTMIWFGRIATLPRPLQLVWELSVIANILGVGVERVWRSWRGR